MMASVLLLLASLLCAQAVKELPAGEPKDSTQPRLFRAAFTESPSMLWEPNSLPYGLDVE